MDLDHQVAAARTALFEALRAAGDAELLPLLDERLSLQARAAEARGPLERLKEAREALLAGEGVLGEAAATLPADLLAAVAEGAPDLARRRELERELEGLSRDRSLVGRARTKRRRLALEADLRRLPDPAEVGRALLRAGELPSGAAGLALAARLPDPGLPERLQALRAELRRDFSLSGAPSIVQIRAEISRRTAALSALLEGAEGAGTRVAQALWDRIDAGEDAPAADQAEALRALLRRQEDAQLRGLNAQLAALPPEE